MVLALTPALAFGEVNESIRTVGVVVSDAYGKRISHDVLVTVIHDTTTPAPRPVVIINHGRPRQEDRAAMGRVQYAAISQWFAELGFLVIVPTRIGYGDTGGEDVEDSGPCRNQRYGPAFAAAADLTIQVLANVAGEPGADATRVLVVGQSFGGTTAIATAARNQRGILAAINFAGGAGGNPVTRPHDPCDPQAIGRLFAEYGASSRIPTLWIYAANDMYWGQDWPRKWFSRFREAGGVGEFTQSFQYGFDGHALFAGAPYAWESLVHAFLLTHAPSTLTGRR